MNTVYNVKNEGSVIDLWGTPYIIVPQLEEDFCCWSCSIIQIFAFPLLHMIPSSQPLPHLCHNNTV
jgi:hypothetical protein